VEELPIPTVSDSLKNKILSLASALVECSNVYADIMKESLTSFPKDSYGESIGIKPVVIKDY
jgi:hypothetical protein